MDVIEAAADLNIFEHGHAEDCEDEHDEEEEEADVEEGRHGHDEREQEGSDTLRSLDQSEYPTHLGNPSNKIIIFVQINIPAKSLPDYPE